MECRDRARTKGRLLALNTFVASQGAFQARDVAGALGLSRMHSTDYTELRCTVMCPFGLGGMCLSALLHRLP